ncbi:MAG TPA: tail fiber protein [Magnetospirillum sp.]|nr:tail fiber protein [Magnetospirillum sp.]
MDSYVGEIRMILTAYAPEGWHLCDGTLMPIHGNEALFSLLGTSWGGDGQNNFGIPDFRGRLPVGQGQAQAPNTALYTLGQTGGVETVTLQAAQLPTHNHTFNVANVTANQIQPSPSSMFGNPVGGDAMYVPSTLPNQTSPIPGENTLLPSGGNLPHDNLMPSFPLSFIICVVGTYPVHA